MTKHSAFCIFFSTIFTISFCLLCHNESPSIQKSCLINFTTIFCENTQKLPRTEYNIHSVSPISRKCSTISFIKLDFPQRQIIADACRITLPFVYLFDIHSHKISISISNQYSFHIFHLNQPVEYSNCVCLCHAFVPISSQPFSDTIRKFRSILQNDSC